MKQVNKPRISKRDWLHAALETLEIGGIDAVRVERLASRLRISKSGFYWHFKDRSELLKEVLNYWSTEYTGSVLQDKTLAEMDAAKRLHTVAELVWEHNLAKYDLAIRIWAKHDLIAKRAVVKVNKLRMDYIRLCFSELGFKGDELEMRTMLFVCYTTWESPMFGKLKKQKWNKMKKRRIKLILSNKVK